MKMNTENLDKHIKKYLKSSWSNMGHDNYELSEEIEDNIKNLLSSSDWHNLADEKQKALLDNSVSIIRLMVKRGDKKTLPLFHAISLSEKIYSLERSTGQIPCVATLYRGIAQIGLKMTEQGMQNVLRGLHGLKNKSDGVSNHSIDLANGYWALMSAAVNLKQLGRAIECGLKWRNIISNKAFSAHEDVVYVNQEVAHANIALCILSLVLGETDKAEEYLQNPQKSLSLKVESGSDSTLKAWSESVNFLQKWLDDCKSKVGVFPVEESLQKCGYGIFTEDIPVFLGFDLNSAFKQYPADTKMDSELKKLSPFEKLCHLRRKYANSDILMRIKG